MPRTKFASGYRRNTTNSNSNRLSTQLIQLGLIPSSILNPPSSGWFNSTDKWGDIAKRICWGAVVAADGMDQWVFYILRLVLF